jgi:YYY domain-containing protein
MAESPVSFVLQLIYVLFWVALFVPATLLFHGLLSRIRDIPTDVSWALAKVLGFFGFAWIIAAPASAGLYELNDGWIRIAFVVFALAGAVLIGKACRFQVAELRANLRSILVPEILFLSVYLVFTFIWSLHCILGGGEKVMNYTFLNFFIHNDQLPPQDPWAAGMRMQYYYFGSFAHALWHRISGIPSAVGYGLAVSTDAAGLAMACYAVLRLAGLRKLQACLFSATCLFAGNVQTIWSVLVEGDAIHSDLFWKSSRVFDQGHFSEFPLWSFIFADLHAHNIGLFLGIACAFFLLALFRSSNRGSSWGIATFLGFTAGLAPISNTWDVFMVMTIFLAIVLSEPRRVLKLIPQLAWAGVVALGTCAPFLPSIMGSKPIQIGILKSEWVTIGQVFLFLGFPLALVFLGALTRFTEGASLKRWGAAAVIFCATIALAYFIHHRIGNPFSTAQIAAQGVAALLVVVVVTNPSVSLVARQLLLASAILMFAIEFVVVFDRTITLFKIYFQLSALLWLAGVVWLTRQNTLFVKMARVLQVSTICLSLASGFILVKSTLPDFMRRLREPNLDGMIAILNSERDMGKLLQWMAPHIQGFPRILDSWGAGGLGRVTMNLGFPNFAHWEAHTVKRGVPHEELIRRRDLINEFYTTADAQRAFEILRDNQIDYFVVSDTERQTYPESSRSAPFEKFETSTQFFNLIHREGGAALYAPNVR